jgi:hypothetical protein
MSKGPDLVSLLLLVLGLALFLLACVVCGRNGQQVPSSVLRSICGW